jgi:hypothetical protein
MAGARNSIEGQDSLSLKEKALSEDITIFESNTGSSPQILPAIITEETELEKAEYITGLKLYVILLGLTLVGFVIMLDQTIVATV